MVCLSNLEGDMKIHNLLIGTGVSFICAICMTALGGIVWLGYSLRSAPNTGSANKAIAAISTRTPTVLDILPTFIPITPTPVDCPDKMEAIIRANQGSVYGPDSSSGNPNSGNISSDSNPNTTTLVTYQVNGNQISDPAYKKVSKNLKKDQQDIASQEQAWQFFTLLIPLQNRRMVSEYEVFTDGPDNVMAAVEQTDDDPAKWIMEIDEEDLQDKNELAFTLVHEDGHLLTLNSQQVPPDIKVFNDPNNDALYNREAAACPTYFTGEGCSKPDSYINQFYDRFWTPIAGEWEKIDRHSNDSDPTEYYDMLYAFYKKHPDQFVDDYATTDPSEDMAETFAYFVYSPKPAGHAIRDQKILFFYDYPEFVLARDQILNNKCSVLQ